MKDYTDVGVQIYPNPAKDRILVEYAGEFDRVTIIDFSGRVIKAYTVRSETIVSLELGDLPGGMYILRVSNKGKSLDFGKFMKLSGL